MKIIDFFVICGLAFICMITGVIYLRKNKKLGGCGCGCECCKKNRNTIRKK